MLFPNGFGQKALKTLTQISLQDATQPGLEYSLMAWRTFFSQRLRILNALLVVAINCDIT